MLCSCLVPRVLLATVRQKSGGAMRASTCVHLLLVGLAEDVMIQQQQLKPDRAWLFELVASVFHCLCNCLERVATVSFMRTLIRRQG